MRKGKVLVAGVLVSAVVSFAGEMDDKALLKKARELFKPIPDKLEKVPGKETTLTPALVKLGKMLYFEPRLSSSHLISCNTCHNVGLGGTDNVETSIGHGWQRGPRNAPTVFNAVFNTAQFWDGRAKDLEEQAKGPIQASVEMNNSPERVVKTLRSIPEYVKLFREAFKGEKDPVTFNNVAKAIEAFEATLLTPNSRFDKFLKGDLNALNKTEKEGLRLFMEKGCASCHNGVNLGGNMYAPFGLVEKPGADILPPGDKGRYQITKTATDKYVFKVPSLRNVELTYPYFHSGVIWSLRDAVEIMASTQLGIKLSQDEVNKITAFLKTLTGERPRVEYPILPPSTDKTPKPVTTNMKHHMKGH